MTAEEKIIRNRLYLLKLIEQPCSFSQAYKIFRYSREVFCRVIVSTIMLILLCSPVSISFAKRNDRTIKIGPTTVNYVNTEVINHPEYRHLAENPDIGPLDLPPAPADGDTVLTDPPGFSWLPEEGSVAFIIEISRNLTFAESESLLEKVKMLGPLIPHSLSSTPLIVEGNSSYLVAGIPLPLYHPSFKLGKGPWAWRWRCVFPGPVLSPPGAAREFVVSKDAWKFLVPPCRELFGRIPSKHPRLFIRPENLDSLRNLLKSSEPHKRLWHRIETFTVDSLLNMPIMKEPAPYQNIIAPDSFYYYTYPFWRQYYNQARKMGQALDFLGFCYLVSGKRKYADRAGQWLMALTRWELDGTSSMSFHDEVAMPVILNGARAYDWIYDTLTESERTAVRKMLIARGEQAYKRWWETSYHTRPYASHATRLVNYMSQAGCVLFGEAEEPEKWLSYVLPIVTTFYPGWGGRDGGYSEGPSYWMMYFNYMLQSAHCIRSAMGLDILKKPFYRNNGYYKIYGDPYFARQRPFADTGVGEYWPANKMNLYRLASVYRNPYFRWRAEMSKPEQMPVSETIIPTGVISFFWLDEHPGHPEPAPPDDLPPRYLFRDIGLAAFHEDLTDPQEVFLLFKSSPYGAWSHIYADQNSFYLQGFGEALAIQSGYYPHGLHPHQMHWTWLTPAHNTVLVDGAGQKDRDRTSRGRIVAFSPGSGLPGSLDYAAGDATEAYQGRLKKFVRHIYYDRPHDFLIIDELEAPEPVRFDWLLHALEKMEIDDETRTVTIKRGKARLTVQFLCPESLSFSQNDKFSVDPGPGYPDQWHLSVSTTEKSEAEVFMVRMKVSRIE